MRVNLAVACVNHQPFKIRLIDQLLQQPFPDTLVAPPDKPPVRIAPPAIAIRKIPPRCPSAQYPKNRVDKLPVVLRNTAPLAFSPRKMWLKQCPRSITNVMPPHCFHLNSMS
jgi:hypothetical protein